MRGPADRFVGVELIEEDDVGGDAGPGDAPARPLWSALGRIPREVVLTAVAALLLGGTGVAVARVGAQRALDARLAEVTGLTFSLAAPLREQWRVPGGLREQRWAHHGTEPAPGALIDAGSTMSDGTIGLELGTWSVTLDVETGAETRVPPEDGDPTFTGTVHLEDGGLLEYGTSPSGGAQTTVHTGAGGEPVTVTGNVLPPAVDDGSMPGAAVVLDFDGTANSQALGVVDLASGERRWTSDVQGGEVAVLSGVVLVAEGARTVALDARTGETRWESTTGSAAYLGGCEVVTDGRRALVVEGDGADRAIVARDVRTGERLWDTEPPLADGGLVPLPDGTVLFADLSEMVALGP